MLLRVVRQRRRRGRQDRGVVEEGSRRRLFFVVRVCVCGGSMCVFSSSVFSFAPVVPVAVRGGTVTAGSRGGRRVVVVGHGGELEQRERERERQETEGEQEESNEEGNLSAAKKKKKNSPLTLIVSGFSVEAF